MSLHKLTPNQVAQKKVAGTANQQYVEALSGLKPGEGGEATVAEEKVSKQTIKNRIKKAADHLEIEVKFIRSSKDEVAFEVVAKQ